MKISSKKSNLRNYDASAIELFSRRSGGYDKLTTWIKELITKLEPPGAKFLPRNFKTKEKVPKQPRDFFC